MHRSGVSRKVLARVEGRRGGGAPRWLLATAVAALTIAAGAAAGTEVAEVAANLGIDEVILNRVCDEVAGSGNQLEKQCLVFDLDGPNRTSAANGNNLGISGGQGATTNQAAEKVKDRLEEIREGGEGGGSAAEWMIGSLGLFISGDGEFSDRDPTLNEPGNDSASGGVTAGADYRITDSLVVGVAISYSAQNTDFDGGAGELDTDTLTGTLYASFAPNETLYFDAYVGYGDLDYDGTRTIAFVTGGVPVAAVAASNTDGDQVIAGFGGGADYYFGGLAVGGHAQFDYSDLDIDAYSETGGAGFAIAYGDQSIVSAQSVIGGHASYALSTSWGVLVPAARLDWVHEFENDARAIAANFVLAPGTPFTVLTDAADSDFARLGLSLAAILPGGWIGFADYQYQFAHSFLTVHRFSAGVRFEF